MKQVLLISRAKIPHYRVAVYNYLSRYLSREGFSLTVASESIDQGNPGPIEFPFIPLPLRVLKLARLLVTMKPEIVIFWVNHEWFSYPVLLLAKILGSKVIHWGHRRNLQHPGNPVNNLIYSLEHRIDDAIILYGEQLRKYVAPGFQRKTFVANNTLNLTGCGFPRAPKGEVLGKHGITTRKNIICMGRLQKRKRIDDLVEAFHRLEMDDVGLILAGPDSEGILSGISGRHIFKPGALYGDDSLDLLAAADVFCLPGAIGLSIVDAFFCGLPVVTEDVKHGPEIMYLKDGHNGFIVPVGDIVRLTESLRSILTDEALRERFSRAARQEIMTVGHIDRMCEGFRDALRFVSAPEGRPLRKAR